MKITVITVAYNSEATVLKTIDSVSNQKNIKLEYIFVDGKSSDNTYKLVKDRGSKIDILISEKDNGIYEAVNKGISQASGEVIALLNSDDYYPNSNVLSEVIALFENDESLEAIMGGVVFVNPENLNKTVRQIKAVNFKPWMMRFGFMPPHPAVFIRKKVYDKIGLYDDSYKIAADFEFLLRLLIIFKINYKVIDAHWVTMRTGGVSTSGWKSRNLITHEMLKALRQNGIYSCILFVWLRFPVKFIRQFI